MVARLLLLLFCLPLLGACARTAVPVTAAAPATDSPRNIFIVPFETAMVPPEVEEELFDRLVDLLNEGGRGKGVEFLILKDGIAKVDPGWLKEQYYITGEILGYVEDSGCCSTALRLRGRARLHHPGGERPASQVDVPRETFFEHDYSTLEAERRKLTEGVASTLAERLLSSLPVR